MISRPGFPACAVRQGQDHLPGRHGRSQVPLAVHRKAGRPGRSGHPGFGTACFTGAVGVQLIPKTGAGIACGRQVAIHGAAHHVDRWLEWRWPVRCGAALRRQSCGSPCQGLLAGGAEPQAVNTGWKAADRCDGGRREVVRGSRSLSCLLCP